MRQALGGIGWTRSASIVVRAGVHPEALSAGIRNVVRAADENVPVVNFQSLDGVVTDTLIQQRFIMLLLALFGGGALAIAAVGVYGVISFSVARRTHEIGIRMALGASQGDVLRQIVPVQRSVSLTSESGFSSYTNLGTLPGRPPLHKPEVGLCAPVATDFGNAP